MPGLFKVYQKGHSSVSGVEQVRVRMVRGDGRGTGPDVPVGLVSWKNFGENFGVQSHAGF